MTGLNKDEHFYSKSEEVSFIDIKNIINKILILGNINNYKVKELESISLINCIKIIQDKKVICKIGEVKESLLKTFEIGQKLYYAEILWENYLTCIKEEFTFTKISKFPEVKRDLSIILSKNQKFSEISTILLPSEDLDKGDISSPIWIKKKKVTITNLFFIRKNSLSPYLQ